MLILESLCDIKVKFCEEKYERFLVSCLVTRIGPGPADWDTIWSDASSSYWRQPAQPGLAATKQLSLVVGTDGGGGGGPDWCWRQWEWDCCCCHIPQQIGHKLLWPHTHSHWPFCTTALFTAGTKSLRDVSINNLKNGETRSCNFFRKRFTLLLICKSQRSIPWIWTSKVDKLYDIRGAGSKISSAKP